MESRIELTDRLRREGRWPEASKRKDEMVKLLRAEGMKRTEAAEEAWRRLAAEYPPLPHTTELEPEPDDDEELAVCVVGPNVLPSAWGDLPESASFEVEVEWVHQNRVLVVEERTGGASRLHWEHARKPAPSYGAVNLMEFAATNRKGFMDILQRVKPATDTGEEENIKRERRSLAEIRGLLERMQEQADEELLANVPQVVRDRVQAVLADWSRQHGLALSRDGTASLEARVADLVQECMSAAGKVELRKEEEKNLAPIGETLAGMNETG
jgi:hypothetical protein